MALHLLPIALSFYKKLHCSKHRMGTSEEEMRGRLALKLWPATLFTLKKGTGADSNHNKERAKYKASFLKKKNCTTLERYRWNQFWAAAEFTLHKILFKARFANHTR